MAPTAIYYSWPALEEAMSKGKGQEWTPLWCNEDSVDLNDSNTHACTHTQSFIIYQKEQDINAAQDLLAEKSECAVIFFTLSPFH